MNKLKQNVIMANIYAHIIEYLDSMSYPQKQKDLAFMEIAFFAAKYIREVDQLTEKEYNNILKEITDDISKDNKHRS